MRTPRALLLGVLACGPLACGGGGSSGPDLLLAGTYHLVGVSARTDGGTRFTTTWGTLAADGAGTLGLTASRNEDGDTSGPSTEPGIPYTVSASRRVTVFDVAEPSLAVAEGRITPEGDVAVLGSSADDREPGLWIAVRKRGTFAPTALVGSYHGCLFFHRLLPLAHVTFTGTWNFDGDGSYDASGLSNADGTTGTFAQSGSWSVTSDGVANISAGTWDLSGGVLEGGRLAVLAGSTFHATSPALLVLIRRTLVSESFEVPTGDNFVSGLQRDVTGSVYRSYWGSFVVETAPPGLDVTWRQNEEGLVSSLPPWAGSWGVDPDALFGFTDADGNSYLGGLDRDGRYAVVAGGRYAPSDPALFLLLR